MPLASPWGQAELDAKATSNAVLRSGRLARSRELQDADERLTSLEKDLAAAQERRSAGAEAAAARQAALLQKIEEMEAAEQKRIEVEKMMEQVAMTEPPPSSFAAFKPVAQPKPQPAGFDANAGGFSL